MKWIRVSRAGVGVATDVGHAGLASAGGGQPRLLLWNFCIELGPTAPAEVVVS
jgi:hypothetical protein